MTGENQVKRERCVPNYLDLSKQSSELLRTYADQLVDPMICCLGRPVMFKVETGFVVTFCRGARSFGCRDVPVHRR